MIGPRRASAALAVAAALAALADAPLSGQPAASPSTFATASDAALATLLHVDYAGGGRWRMCDRTGCPEAVTDWGADGLTYALWLRWQASRDPELAALGKDLAAALPDYTGGCDLPACAGWSDVPEWDAIAAVRDFEPSRDPKALARAEAAFAYVQNGDAFSLGACPDVRYQQPGGHARVFVDGHETFDRTGIWQNKSSSGLRLPGSVLFAWRWPRPGSHTIRFAPEIPNAKEGGSFLHVRGYLIVH